MTGPEHVLKTTCDAVGGNGLTYEIMPSPAVQINIGKGVKVTSDHKQLLQLTGFVRLLVYEVFEGLLIRSVLRASYAEVWETGTDRTVECEEPNINATICVQDSRDSPT